MMFYIPPKKKGRPTKFGEPTIRKTFRFPASMFELFKKESKADKRDMTDILLELVQDYLDMRAAKKQEKIDAKNNKPSKTDGDESTPNS